MEKIFNSLCSFFRWVSWTKKNRSSVVCSVWRWTRNDQHNTHFKEQKFEVIMQHISVRLSLARMRRWGKLRIISIRRTRGSWGMRDEVKVASAHVVVVAIDCERVERASCAIRIRRNSNIFAAAVHCWSIRGRLTYGQMRVERHFQIKKSTVARVSLDAL